MARGFSIEMLGNRKVVQRLSAGAKGLADTTTLHRRIGIKILQLVQFAFRRQKSPEGKAWKKLAKTTIFARKKRSKAILQDTGGLRKSYVFSANRVQARVGSKSKLSIIHQEGTKAKIIKAKSGKVLLIPWPPGHKGLKATKLKSPVGGATHAIFRKKVKHPGLPARPMMPQLATSARVAQTVTDNYVREVTKKANRGQGPQR